MSTDPNLPSAATADKQLLQHGGLATRGSCAENQAAAYQLIRPDDATMRPHQRRHEQQQPSGNQKNPLGGGAATHKHAASRSEAASCQLPTQAMPSSWCRITVDARRAKPYALGLVAGTGVVPCMCTWRTQDDQQMTAGQTHRDLPARCQQSREQDSTMGCRCVCSMRWRQEPAAQRQPTHQTVFVPRTHRGGHV